MRIVARELSGPVLHVTLSTTPGVHSAPSLKGVVGRRAAIVDDYAYSPALKKAGEDGLVWNEHELAEFLASPSRKIPGTKMRFWGLWSFEIDDLIAFLKANP